MSPETVTCDHGSGDGDGGGGGGQAHTSGRTQVARGVSHHAARRRADRVETGAGAQAEERILAVVVVAVAEPEQAVVAAHVVPAGRVPRADGRRQEEQRYAGAGGRGAVVVVVSVGGGGGGGDGRPRPAARPVVSVGRAQGRTVPEPIQVAGRRHQETYHSLRFGPARQRRRV